VFISGTAPTEVCNQHEGWYWGTETYPAPEEEFPPEEPETPRPPG
jgi:hypothetical protein